MTIAVSPPMRLSAAGLHPVTVAGSKQFDLIVIGSGAGGLTAALTAARAGLKTLVIEKSAFYGGSSAMSGGALWIPGSDLARRAGVEDGASDVKEYLHSAAPAALGSERLDAFLEHGPRMLDFVSRNSPVRFVLGRHVSDYHTDAPQARPVGRCVVAGSLDARAFGATLRYLAPPLVATTVAGLPLEQGRVVTHMFAGDRSWRAIRKVARMLMRASIDRLRFGRIARLSGGQALMTGLMHAALESRVEVWLSAAATRLMRDASGAVNGVEVRTSTGVVSVAARVGVVLATGGFAHDAKLTRSLYAHVAGGSDHGSVAVSSACGDGIRMGCELGATLDHAAHGAAAWIPVSRVPSQGGGHVYPHFSDRAKPGVIAVGPDGRRFVNEASSYHEFVRGMFAACRDQSSVSAWLIADARAIKRYGLGFARPAPWPLESCVRSGYLLRAASLPELAEKIGVDGATLSREVERFNDEARRGSDAAFGKGSTAYNQKMGDPSIKPNPCLAPLEHAPFYAVRLMPGDLGTFTGLRTDANACVLSEDGMPICGLYAVGADMTNPLAGAYPGAGTTLGPIMTFAYVCGLHAVRAANAQGAITP